MGRVEREVIGRGWITWASAGLLRSCAPSTILRETTCSAGLTLKRKGPPRRAAQTVGVLAESAHRCMQTGFKQVHNFVWARCRNSK